MRRIITLKLTRAEAESLMNAGNRGVADLVDAQFDEDLEAAGHAEAALNKLGQAMSAAWPEPAQESP